MRARSFVDFDPQRVPSPCFVVDVAAIEQNLAILADVAAASGAKVLAALKAFSLWELGPLTARYLDGTCASGLHEARLGHEHYPGECHVFSAAFRSAELAELATFADHIVLNSFSQWQRFKPQLVAAQQLRPELQFGLRINPQHSEGTAAIYDPCAPCSRLGIPAEQFAGQSLDGITGLHFHTLCEQGFEPLQRTLAAVEAQFGDRLGELAWVNFGGGHHITQPGYDIDGLVAEIRRFSAQYGVQVYLEPGEAVAINSGVLVAEVLDITHNGRDLAILDSSATCHMPDTLEMPYRPGIRGAGAADDGAATASHPYSYRLGGMTCLAGDVIGDYAFAEPLAVGERLLFDDMAHYTMVKTSTFNGINLPAIALWDSRSDELQVIKQFGYQDFKERLS